MFGYFQIVFALCVTFLSFIFIVVCFYDLSFKLYYLGEHFGCHNVSYVIDLEELMQIAR
jgi:hypothetical protein